MLRNLRSGVKTHLNMFIERPQVEAWANHLGMELKGFDFGPPHGGRGQTVAMMKKSG